MTINHPDPASGLAEPLYPGFDRDDETTITALFPGLVAVVLIGWAAYWLSQLHPALDILVMAILLGILVRTVSDRLVALLPGAKMGVKLFIPAGIILYGTTIQASAMKQLPMVAILLTLVCMLAFFILIILLNRVLRVPKKSSDLVATGSAVCGASAIAVLSPAIEAEPKDISVSLLVITTVGLLGAMLYPLLRTFLGLPDMIYAIFSGATLPQLGIVRTVTAGMSSEMIQSALAVKSLRIVMLLVVVLVYALRYQRTIKGSRPAQLHRSSRLAALFTPLSRVWFIVPFLLLALLPALLPDLRIFTEPLRPLAAILLAFALGSVGILVDIESVMVTGSRPLIAGLLGWMGVIILFLLIWPFFL